MRLPPSLWLLLPMLASACIETSSSPDLGACAQTARGGQSFGEIGIGTCLAGPVDLAFFEDNGTSWLAIANANPNENFSTGSVLVLDWNSIDLTKRRNNLADVTAYATPVDALVAGMGVIERDDARLLLLSDRLSEGSLTQSDDDRALVIDITDPTQIAPWSQGAEIALREDPGAVAIADGVAFVANLTDKSISVLDTTTSPIAPVELSGRSSVSPSRLRDDDGSGTRALATATLDNRSLVIDDTWTFRWVTGTNRLFAPLDGGIQRYTGSEAVFGASPYGIELSADLPDNGHNNVEDPAFSALDGPQLWFADDSGIWASNLLTGGNWAAPGLFLTGGASWDRIVGAPQRVSLDAGEAVYYDGRATQDGASGIGVALRVINQLVPEPGPIVPLGDFDSLSDPWVVDDPFARTLRMWMTAEQGTDLVVAVSESDDGLSWSEPVTVLTGLSAPTVRYQNGRYRMVGSLAVDDGFTPATTTSIDGITWTEPLIVDDGLLYDAPSRIAVQSQTTSAWRVESENLGQLDNEIASGGVVTIIPVGLSFRVSSGYQLAPSQVRRDLVDLWPTSRATIGGVDTLYATAQTAAGALTTLRFVRNADTWTLADDEVIAGPDTQSLVVVPEGSAYRAFYAVDGSNGTPTVATATSPDGITFTETSRGRLPRLPFNDGGAIPHSATPLPGGGWRVWYSASDDSRWRIGAADTVDGSEFTNVPSSNDDFQLGLGEPGTLDDSGAREPYVAVIDGIEHLWYAGSPNGSTHQILHAQRAVGDLDWVRDDSDTELLFGLGRSFSAAGVRSPVVRVTGDQVEVLHSGTDGVTRRIGEARGTATRWFPVQAVPTVGDSLTLYSIRGGVNADVIDLNQTIRDFNTTGVAVSSLTYDEPRGMLYVTQAQRGSTTRSNYIQVLDVRDDSDGGFLDSNAFDLEAVLQLDSGLVASGMRDVVVIPGRDRLYATAENPDSVVAIDLSGLVDDSRKDLLTDVLIGSLPLLRVGTIDPGRPYADEDQGAQTGANIAGAGLALAPDGVTLFVAHFRDNSVVVIDTSLGAWGEVVRRIPNVGENPHRIAISPDGRHAVVANYLGEVDETLVSSTLAVIDIDPDSLTYLEVVTWLVNR